MRSSRRRWRAPRPRRRWSGGYPRTLPTRARPFRDRTNAKIRRRRRAARLSTALLKSRVAVHDTLAFTAPRFDANAQHHYIGFTARQGAEAFADVGDCAGGLCCGGGVGPAAACPWAIQGRTATGLGTPYYVGNDVGLSDLNALLNGLCNDDDDDDDDDRARARAATDRRARRK